MKRKTLAIGVSLLTVSALAACGSSSPPPPTLTVASASVQASIGGMSPPGGRYWAEVDVDLQNPQGGGTVSGWWYYFALATKSGLILSPSTESNLVGNPCASDTLLGPGASFKCTLVFDVPCGETPVGLSYEAMEATAPVVLAPPTTCGSTSTGAGGAGNSGGGTGGA